MNAREFYEAVVKMRNAQREYYKFKSHSNLVKAKRLEKVVDDEIVRVNERLEAKRNPKLL